MAKTYEPIATTTIGSATNTVSFTSISGTYTDLVLVSNTFQTSNSNMRLRLGNGSVDTGFNYSNTYLGGDGSSAFSGRVSGESFIEANYQPANTWGQSIINVQNYSNTTTYKTSLIRSGQAGALTIAYVGLWRSTSAITAINLYTSAGNFDTGSTFTLYGIKAA
jgi:hypothetical protein